MFLKLHLDYLGKDSVANTLTYAVMLNYGNSLTRPFDKTTMLAQRVLINLLKCFQFCYNRWPNATFKRVSIGLFPVVTPTTSRVEWLALQLFSFRMCCTELIHTIPCGYYVVTG